MRYVLAFFFPWMTFFTMKRFGSGFLCFLLQLSMIGWLPAVIWAFASVGAYNADKRTDRLVDAMAKNSSSAKPIPTASIIPDYLPPSPQKVPIQPIPTVESYLRSLPTGSPSNGARAAVSPDPLRAGTPVTERSYDERKWRALIRFDEEIEAAAKRTRALGGQWEDELASSYLRLNDKSYLEALVEKIAKEAWAQGA